MDVDGETALAWLRAWGVEAVLAAVSLTGLVAGATDGATLTLLLGLALAATTADRVRLRMDNRSLAAAVEEASERRVSAARRETPADRADTGGSPDASGPAGEERAARVDEAAGDDR